MGVGDGGGMLVAAEFYSGGCFLRFQFWLLVEMEDRR